MKSCQLLREENSITMAIDKNKLIRYRVYDQCFSNFNKMYTRSMLRDKVNEALLAADLEEVGQSTVNHDISPNGNFVSDMSVFMEDVCLVAYKSSSGIEGTNETTYYRYSKRGFSIWKVDLEETQLQQLQNALLMLKQFKGLPDMDWVQDLMESLCKRYKIELPKADAIVELDYCPDLVGLDSFFASILNATLHKSALNITYNGGYTCEYQDIIHPYYIKEYNNRWFVFAWSEKDERVNTMAIDRFVAVEQSNNTYKENTKINFARHFNDVIGVTHYDDVRPEIVRLRFTPQRYNYVATKKLHETQQKYDNRCEIIIRVRPNRELEALILSFGADVEVLEPQSLRDTIAEKIQSMASVYFKE